MVERWNRHLKDALSTAADNFSWMDRLPLIMLNLRIALEMKDSQAKLYMELA